MRRAKRAILGLIGVIATAAVPAAASPAQATDDDRLPLPDYGDIAVDDVHKRLFISGGPTTNGIVVTDFSGKVKKTITGQSGATGLVLSTDSKTLYAALASGDAISLIDTVTLAETARFPVGAQVCPTHLARTGAIVWFGYGCEDDWTGKIGKLDTAAVPPLVTLDQQGDALFQRAPLLSASPEGRGIPRGFPRRCPDPAVSGPGPAHVLNDHRRSSMIAHLFTDRPSGMSPKSLMATGVEPDLLVRDHGAASATTAPARREDREFRRGCAAWLHIRARNSDLWPGVSACGS